MNIPVEEKLKYIEYLESCGGRLTQPICRVKWPDGTVTDSVWQYAAGDTVTTGKTVMDAVKRHLKISLK